MKNMKYLWPYIRPYTIAFCVAPLFIFAEVMAGLIQPNLMAKIVNQGLAHGDRALVISTGIRMCWFTIIGLGCGLLSISLSANASNRFGAALRLGLYRKIQTFSFANIESFHTGSLITRLTNDTTLLQQLVQAMLRVLIRAPLMLLGSIFMAMHINHSLMSVLFLLIPVLIAIIVLVFKKAFPLFMLTQKRLDGLNTVVQENLSGVRVVKAFSGEKREHSRFQTANQELRNISLASGKVVILLIPLLMLAMNIGVIAVVGFGALKVQAGELAIGDIMAYTNYLANILQALMVMSFVLMAFSRAEASLARVAEVFETEPDIVAPLSPTNAKTPSKAAPQSVTFESVFFTYSSIRTSGGADSFVLNDISFHLEPGDTLGIIGSTGSGKSSLLSLISRLYDVTRGRVLVGGRDVRDMPIEELRSHIGLVMQESLLFSGTIAENIRWGKPDATDEEVREAARFAEADEFVRSFPDGYATMIGQRGVDLSGGQKQRLSIARTLVGRPDLILFDDCTSAVDFRTEALIRQHISRFKTTRIIVAQRVSSIVHANSILVIEKGHIAEQGTHETLWRKNGIYRAICDSQPGSIPEGLDGFMEGFRP